MPPTDGSGVCHMLPQHYIILQEILNRSVVPTLFYLYPCQDLLNWGINLSATFQHQKSKGILVAILMTLI
jgi:hypothetical protein